VNIDLVVKERKLINLYRKFVFIRRKQSFLAQLHMVIKKLAIM